MFISFFICTLISPTDAFASTDGTFTNQHSSQFAMNQFLLFFLGDKESGKKEWDYDDDKKSGIMTLTKKNV